jgi:hypothetical protein
MGISVQTYPLAGNSPVVVRMTEEGATIVSIKRIS